MDKEEDDRGEVEEDEEEYDEAREEMPNKGKSSGGSNGLVGI